MQGSFNRDAYKWCGTQESFNREAYTKVFHTGIPKQKSWCVPPRDPLLVSMNIHSLPRPDPLLVNMNIHSLPQTRSFAGEHEHTLTSQSRSFTGEHEHTLTSQSRSFTGEHEHTLTSQTRSFAGEHEHTLTSQTRSFAREHEHRLTSQSTSHRGGLGWHSPQLLQVCLFQPFLQRTQCLWLASQQGGRSWRVYKGVEELSVERQGAAAVGGHVQHHTAPGAPHGSQQ